MKVREVFLLLTPLLLAACDNISSDKASTAKPKDNMQYDAELQVLIRQVKSNLVFVEGGKFLMGPWTAESYGAKLMKMAIRKNTMILTHKILNYFLSN